MFSEEELFSRDRPGDMVVPWRAANYFGTAAASGRCEYSESIGDWDARNSERIREKSFECLCRKVPIDGLELAERDVPYN